MKPHLKLRQLRREKGYSISALARKVGVCPQYLGEIERGKKTLSYKMAFKISYCLGTTPNELFLDYFKN